MDTTKMAPRRRSTQFLGLSAFEVSELMLGSLGNEDDDSGFDEGGGEPSIMDEEGGIPDEEQQDVIGEEESAPAGEDFDAEMVDSGGGNEEPSVSDEEQPPSYEEPAPQEDSGGQEYQDDGQGGEEGGEEYSEEGGGDEGGYDDQQPSSGGGGGGGGGGSYQQPTYAQYPSSNVPVCPAGSVWDDASQQCVWQMPGQAACPDGQAFDAASGQCVQAVTTCPAGTYLNAAGQCVSQQTGQLVARKVNAPVTVRAQAVQDEMKGASEARRAIVGVLTTVLDAMSAAACVAEYSDCCNAGDTCGMTENTGQGVCLTGPDQQMTPAAIPTMLVATCDTGCPDGSECNPVTGECQSTSVLGGFFGDLALNVAAVKAATAATRKPVARAIAPVAVKKALFSPLPAKPKFKGARVNVNGRPIPKGVRVVFKRGAKAAVKPVLPGLTPKPVTPATAVKPTVGKVTVTVPTTTVRGTTVPTKVALTIRKLPVASTPKAPMVAIKATTKTATFTPYNPSKTVPAVTAAQKAAVGRQLTAAAATVMKNKMLLRK